MIANSHPRNTLDITWHRGTKPRICVRDRDHVATSPRACRRNHSVTAMPATVTVTPVTESDVPEWAALWRQYLHEAHAAHTMPDEQVRDIFSHRRRRWRFTLPCCSRGRDEQAFGAEPLCSDAELLVEEEDLLDEWYVLQCVSEGVSEGGANRLDVVRSLCGRVVSEKAVWEDVDLGSG